MSEPKTFYNREDQWQIPSAADQKDDDDRFMRHLVMRLPEEKQAEYIYMAPFTPRGKNNLAAWMVARNDGANYGKLRVYRFPKQSLVYGPAQISARINQDTDISRELTLWDQRGSEVIKGELLVIPIEEALIYVQPIYLRAQGGQNSRAQASCRSVPGSRRHVGNFRDWSCASVQWRDCSPAPGADSSAQQDTSQASRPSSAGPPTANQQMLKEANDHYQRAISAQRAGDWAAYGREIQQLGEVLKRLNVGAR